METISFNGFCDFTDLEDDDTVTTFRAWIDFLEQDLPLYEWWANYQGRYI